MHGKNVLLLYPMLTVFVPKLSKEYVYFNNNLGKFLNLSFSLPCSVTHDNVDVDPKSVVVAAVCSIVYKKHTTKHFNNLHRTDYFSVTNPLYILLAYSVSKSVREQLSNVRKKMFKFKHPFSMIIAGPSGCGKTTFTKKLLENLDCMVDKTVHKVVWCHAEKNALPNLKLKNNIAIEYILGLPDEFDNPGNKPMLVILDDLMLEAYNTKICELFTKGSHHRNLSVILITQNIFHQGSHCRDISLNAKYIVIFKNPRDKMQFHHLARQIYPENPKELLKIYKEITQKPHGYLLIDLTQGIDEALRFRTDIFQKNFATILCDLNEVKKRKNVKNKTFGNEQIYALCSEPSQL